MNILIPRGRLDFSARDIVHLFLKQNPLPDNPLEILSVRSGLDLILTQLALPKGSEVLMSCLTIPDIAKITRAHGLKIIPIDIEPQTLSLDLEHLNQSRTAQTKIILVAHLFGARMEMEAIATFASQYNLLLIEDCAQSFDASGYCKHPQTDYALYSFGTIKTHTCFGGGLIYCKDKNVQQSLALLHSSYPTQKTRRYLFKILKLSLLNLISLPYFFGMLVWLLQKMGHNYDTVFASFTRGFSGGAFFTLIRQKPCTALVRMMRYRVANACRHDILARITQAKLILNGLAAYKLIGEKAQNHSHWVVPILSDSPQNLVASLFSEGFDATIRASSLTIIDEKNSNCPKTQGFFKKMLYVPFYKGISQEKINALNKILNRT